MKTGSSPYRGGIPSSDTARLAVITDGIGIGREEDSVEDFATDRSEVRIVVRKLVSHRWYPSNYLFTFLSETPQNMIEEHLV